MNSKNSSSYFKKYIEPDIGGAHTSEAAVSLPDDLLTDETEATELYAEPVPPITLKKHSPSFIHNRLKARKIAEGKLTRFSDELFKLADEVRYYEPLIAEMLDDAWDAVEEAIAMMQDED